MTTEDEGIELPDVTVGDEPTPIGRLLARMDATQAPWPANDARRSFHSIYTRTTKAFGEEIARGGFLDPAWVERWDIVFADLYLDAVAAWERGGAEATPGPWAIAFATARDRGDLQQLRHILFGLNVHINYDLPQALLAVITDDEFDDPECSARRAKDHEHGDVVLLARVAKEDQMIGGKTLLDRLLTPLSRRATKRFIAEARTKVWRNARALSLARRQGAAELEARTKELEDLCAARVRDLVEPGQVLLKLARRGFGVVLRDA
jgi:uncharacterized protein DUF5995